MIKKAMKIWGLIAILIIVVSCFSWVAGLNVMTDSSKSVEQENIRIATKQDEVKNESICAVTLITGDVIIVSTLPDGRRGFAIKPADPTKLGQNFQIIETPKGTYIFPEGIDLSKVDKELFNIDYLIEEEYYNKTYLPVLVDYKEERAFGATEEKELEKEVNITIVKNYHAIPTFSAKLSFESINETFKTLVERPEIKKIWLDKKVKASLYESVPLIGAPELWKSGYNGSGLEIAILDTGIDDTHPDLDDLDDNPATNDPKVIVKVDFTDDNTTEDLYGHGTHCAGIAAGTGNASSLIPLKSSVSTRPPENETQEDFEHRYSYENDMREDLHSSHADFENEDVSVKERIYISKETLPDAYEPDDNYTEANWISTDGTKQTHNFHVSGDHNWMKFNATENVSYLIETADLGSECDTYMYLYDGDGTTEITHDDDGGVGLASRIVWECSISGTYYIMVRHYSSSASGPDTNYNIFVIEGYYPPAEFNDVYSDYGEDTDGDGLYDYLVVDVGVNVTEAGDYRVSGYLYENGTYDSVDYAYNTTYLNEGSQTVQLRFEGIKIRQNEYSGTYDLKSLYLYNSSTGVQLDYRYYAYTTSYYNWTDFQIPPAEFNEVYSDNGTDTDGDGLYNYLAINVGVDVTKAGYYRVEVDLHSLNGTIHITQDSVYKYLSTGVQNVTVLLDGIDIRKSKINGPYLLDDVWLYDESWQQLDYRDDPCITSYYNYTDFQEFARYIGVAPGAYLWNVKVLNQYGWGYTSWVIDGVEYAAYGPDNISNTGDEADIISMSLGGYPEPEEEDPLCQAVNEAVEQGLVVAVAAGNEYDYFSISSPGTASKVITVGASDKEDELAYFSSKGPTIDFYVKPDVLAPGVDIIAPRASGTSMGYPINDYYTRASGTSMATPHVAGVAALILQVHPVWTPKEVKNALISTADDLGYNVYEQGGGRIYVPAAASPKIFVEPATISFKNLETTSETITFENLDTVAHTLTLDVTVREVLNDTQVDCAYLNRTSLSIAPGSSASVLLTINDTSLPHSLYSGKISAAYSGGVVRSFYIRIF